MEIEQEIKQDKFKDEHHKMIVNLMFTSSWLNLMLIKFLQKWDLSPQQYNLLRILRGMHPKPAGICTIQERMLDKTSNASRLVEKLRQKELVTRLENMNDRRLVDVSITDKAISILSEIDEENLEFEKNFRNLSSEEANILNKLLNKLRTNNHY